MKKKKRLQKSKGFTLIEMLVVIVVIGILATIVLVSVSSGRKKAQATKAKTDMVELSKAFEMAASAGCRNVNFTAAGQFNCTPTSGGALIELATISTPPPGVTYQVQLSAGTSTHDGTGWSGASTGTINGGYSFRSTGFTNAQTFSCNDGTIVGQARTGCYCSANDGCTTTQ